MLPVLPMRILQNVTPPQRSFGGGAAPGLALLFAWTMGRLRIG
jgi:hypothetical protein